MSDPAARAARREVHVLTPGDHFSPRTGSAVPTVVDGLCRHRPAGTGRPAVLVASDTYPDRYDSADILEYEPIAGSRRPAATVSRAVDAALGRVGAPRAGARRVFRQVLQGQAAWDPSVIVAHNAPQLVPVVDARRHRSVLVAHNTLLRSYTRREAGAVLDRAAMVVCVSSWLAEQTARHLPAHLGDRLRVLPNGVDAGAFAPPAGVRAARAARAEAGSLRVLYIGRIIPDKGVHVLVDAVSRLAHLPVELTVVGSRGFSADDRPTPYELEVRRAMDALGPRASWLPFQPRHALAPLLHEADVLVVPSTGEEAFALTVLEGMAAGAAVVASRTGGVPEAVAGAGLLVDPGDSVALAAALEGLAQDRRELLRLQEAGLRRARLADWSRIAEQWHVLASEISG